MNNEMSKKMNEEQGIEERMIAALRQYLPHSQLAKSLLQTCL